MLDALVFREMVSYPGGKTGILNPWLNGNLSCCFFGLNLLVSVKFYETSHKSAGEAILPATAEAAAI